MIEDLIEFCKGKSIAIVGNAESIFEKKRNIDEYDIVIRMNRGVELSLEQKSKIGSKCDIYCCSGAGLSTNATLEEPTFKMWMTTFFREKAPKDFLFYPEEQWAKLQEQLWVKLREQLGEGVRPSTGLMVVDFIHNNTNYKNIKLFGFDGWQTKTWYMNRRHIAQTHKPDAETRIIQELLLKSKNITMEK